MKSRRDFLRSTILGAGALSLTPCLKSFAGEAATSGFPKRFVFIRKSNGERPNEVALPTLSAKDKSSEEKKLPFEVDLRDHELPLYLRALEKHKSNMCILQGLSCMMSENGHYSFSSVMGAYKSNRNSLSGIKRATIDFELAKLFPSPFGHVELSLTGDYSTFRTGIVSGYSASAAHQRNYCYADPQTAFNELFRSVTNPGAVESDNAMLKFLESEESFKAGILQGYEKLKLSNHIDSIEAIQARNQKLSKMAGSIARHIPQIGKIHADGGPNASYPEKQEAMTEILIAALITGLTNVVTYTIDELSTPVRGLPGNESDRISIHAIGHNESYSGVPADKIRENIRIGHIQQVARIVERLKATPEGNGTLFDNTMIMYFPEGGETHHGWGFEAPFVIMAGNNCKLDMAGRYIRLPYHGTEGHKTIGNWYTTLLNAHGNPIKHYGDFDLEMSRKKLDQAGPIKRFLA
ncbi:DUF1552 domain-containing protein [Humisphaera borealis]|uniref:DUF1552 domain-containing protein n=1 Tax=Humisphaera borealis TaxID=2807512 RepID=A0A7M2WPQ6_9BACT|nr:DUF1552 domain-containing protein [Humisphaera borealis]QOV87389.1 DUF1552 domain-containing protein [Humisphaera borealis]